MAIAETPTLLALDRWAQIIGIPPAHFNGAYNDDALPVTASCSHVFYQQDWQAFDRVSREQVAQEIAIAEAELAEVLGFWPAPVWIAEEVQQYPRPHRRDWLQTGMRDVRGYRKAVKARWGKVIAAGQRAETIYTSATVANGRLEYRDDDGDGVNETARVTFLNSSDLDPCELKVFYSGYGAEPAYEIRPPRRVFQDPSSDYVFEFWAWQFLDLDLVNALPTGTGPDPLDYNVASNLVTGVDLFRVYHDSTAQSAKLYWEPDVEVDATVYCPACAGSGCEVCSLSTQDGCAHVANAEEGLLVPTPGTYDDDDARWEEVAMSINRDPDFVKLWYRAGDLSQGFLRGLTTGYEHDGRGWRCDPLSNFWAQIITWISVARLRRPLCGCNNVMELVHELQQDATRIETDGNRWAIVEDDVRNPFGTRVGEIRAWRRIERIARRKVEGAVLP